ncbi:MAG: hypothetical protein SW833_25130 [Cyanobacteriota bacterium]|nr:hypothetical protein [Cyanobacteriota bacterium]
MTSKLLHQRHFLPVLSIDWLGLLKRLEGIEGEYGILAPITCHNSLLQAIRELGKPFFIDSGIFEKAVGTLPAMPVPWYCRMHCEFRDGRWVREVKLAREQQLRQQIRNYLERCDRFSPDYVFALDVYGEPLLSLHLARLSWEEYWNQPRTYTLIGVAQVGEPLYNWHELSVPQTDDFLPHYRSPKSFIAPLINAYRDIGYRYVALGGLLKLDRSMPTGLRFGLSPEELDNLLSWTRPEFVLGGLALSRLDVFKKHRVWADSTNWLWWDARYDRARFGHRNALQEVVTAATTFSATTVIERN